MNKKLLITTMLFAAMGLAACGGPGTGDVSSKAKVESSVDSGIYTVTFHKNDGSADDVIKTETINKGQKVARPTEDPTREGFVFDTWYKDAEKVTVYDFNKAVNRNTNIYAGWLEILDVKFDLNYAGAAAATTVKVTEGQKVAEPTDPTRAGYAFTGWKLSADGPHFYDFNQPVAEALTLYASWGEVGAKKIKAVTLEAELCPCITEDRDGLGMQGATYSGGSNGRNLIQKDDRGVAKASGGYFVHHLYEKGNNLIFNIQADEQDTNVVIYMRLSAEYKNPVVINKDMYKVKLNDVAINYGSITFTEVPEQGKGWKPFADYILSASLTLKAGGNKIEMITDNDEKMYGTALHTAPMVDALKVYSTSTVTWPEAKPANLITDSE